MEDRAKTILSYLRSELLDDPEIDISKTTSLFQDRVLSSFNLIVLIGFIEEKFTIKIKPSEVSIENLDSVDNIVAFLDKKLKDPS